MTTVVRRPGSWLIPDVMELFEGSWPFSGRHPVQVEDFVEDGAYVLRAELPGLDAESDIAVSAGDHRLTIAAKREQETHEQQHSEFRYGSFSRTVTLPKGADTEAISATYNRGILEVRVPVTEPASERRIPVEAQTE